MQRTGRGRTALVVTSAGPTSIAAQMALELGDALALKTSWIVANTGICDIRFRGDEMTLLGRVLRTMVAGETVYQYG